MAPYNNNIPQPPDLLSESQDEIHDNFADLFTAVGINHVNFNNGADSGKHNMLTLPVRQPIQAVSATEAGLFANFSARTEQPEISYKLLSFGALFSFMTMRRTPMPPIGSSWAILGGTGLLMKWGYAEITGAGTVIFPDDDNIAIPRFTTAPYNIQVSAVGAGAVDLDGWVRTVAKTALQFTVFCSSRTTVGADTVGFYYLAIGR